MPHQRFKSENYNNLGGINTKISPYQTGPFEFLDLTNLDFQMPNSLTQRWGSTHYVTQAFGQKITSLYEYIQISGASYVLMSHTGGIWFGATTGNSQGLSLTLQGTTRTLFMSFYQIRPGTPVTVQNTAPWYNGQYLLNPYDTASLGMFYINPMVNGSNNLDYSTFQNFLFAADGQKFFKFNGITTFNVGMIPAVSQDANYRMTDLTDMVGPAPFSYGIGCSTGFYAFYASYVNNRGVEGDIWPVLGVNTNGLNGVTIGVDGTTIGFKATYMAPYVQLYTPLEYGISTINIYYIYSGTTLVMGQTTFWNQNYKLLNTFAASGSTTTEVYFGTSLGGISTGYLINNNGSLPSDNQYFALGTTLLFAENNVFGAIGNIAIANFFPSILEVYQNRLFLGGFSSTPSTVWFSETGEPEGYYPENNFEVRTNDGDIVTALRAYSTRLYVLKRNSFYALYGDNPANFYLQEISLEYGCMNNRCAIVYDDILIFLDRKGVVKYNGANIEILSNKVQEYFDRMNYSAAITEACMEHDKLRNQILISIPIDGATQNNVILVYDYLVGAWTKYQGPKVSALKSIQGRNNTKNIFSGSYSGIVSWYGPSFLSDSGTGITIYAKSRFLKPYGDSIQEQHRKLYLNVDATSSTMSLELNFYQDYGPSIILGRTFVISSFQNVMNFGISARSLAFEIKTIQSSQLFRFHGFTLESRFQRRY